MFTIQQIDPKVYRKNTRRATFRIMAIFAVIASPLSHFAPYVLSMDVNPYILNFSGALLGLFITFWIVKTFYADKEWMKEAMYAWRLKRNMAKIYNRIRPLQAKIEEGDEQAIKIVRFYHLATEQMHHLENNSHDTIELLAEKRALEAKMEQFNLDLSQTSFDDELLVNYKLQTDS